MPRLWLEDFVPGTVSEFGPRTVTREEIIAFAAEFDPQPFHLDEDAGRASLLGGLAASGWHTCSLAMRMIADGFILDSAGLGSPGVDEVRWLRPVRPGDRLMLRSEVIEARVSQSKPDRGIVHFRFELRNQADEPVMVMTNPIMFRRRPEGVAP